MNIRITLLTARHVSHTMLVLPLGWLSDITSLF